MMNFKWYGLKRLFFAILIGIFFSIFYLQEDPAFKSYIEDKIASSFSSSFSCNFKAKLSKISLLTGQLVLEDIHVASPAFARHSFSEDGWSWTSKKATSNISFFSFFWNAKIDLDIYIDDIVVTSQVDSSGNLLITPHLKLLMDLSPVDVPIVLRAFVIKHGHVVLQNGDQNSSFSSEFWLNCATLSNSFKTSLKLHEGKLKVQNSEVINSLSGEIVHNIYLDQLDKFDIAVSLKFDIDKLNKKTKTCFLDGSLIDNSGIFKISSVDKLLDMNLKYRSSDFKKLEVDGKFGLNYISSILGIKIPNFENNICDFKGQLDLQDSDILFSGDLNINKIKSGILEFGGIHASVSKDKLGLNANISIDNFYGSKATGILIWDNLKKSGVLKARNSLQADLGSSWRISPSDFSVEADFKSLSDFNGFLKFKISHPRIDQIYDINAKFAGSLGQIDLSGNFNESVFGLKLKTDNKISLESFEIKDSTKKVVLDMGSGKKTSGPNFNLNVDYKLIKDVLAHFQIEDFQGTGTVNIGGEFNSKGLKANLSMTDANIKLSKTNNLIKNFACELDFNLPERKIKILKLNLGFAKGFITSSKSVINFSDFTTIDFIHMPLKIEGFMLSWQRDFFATLSGAILLKYINGDKPKITGSLILDKSYLRNNIFSAELQKNLRSVTVSPLTSYKSDCEINVSLLTRAPLKIKTSFLDSTAKLNLNFAGTIFNPIISGAIEVVGGSFAFPYKPLFITSGKVYFLPNQISDATIELKAQQKIKKYDVFMNISGNLNDPQIDFESMPQLSKEQIISLLWAGSEAGSLYMIMPNVVMQNVQKLIFGQEENVSKAQRYFKNMFKPFERVRIIPDFSDQTGRGGLRGSIEIDVNDRLRGLIQKNFSLSEDVKLEVDYDLTDDASIRAIRDERGDLGAELEMRWKF